MAISIEQLHLLILFILALVVITVLWVSVG